MTRLALMIQVSGKQRDGFTLGKLYVDDAQIMPKCFPDGELRAVWCGLPKAKDREAGLRETGETVGKVKGAGLNTLLIWTESVYIAALDRAAIQQASHVPPGMRWARRFRPPNSRGFRSTCGIRRGFTRR